MYFFPVEEDPIKTVKIKCGENGCNGILICEHFRDDFSPRVHTNCTECNRFVSVKLKYIDDDRIIKED